MPRRRVSSLRNARVVAGADHLLLISRRVAAQHHTADLVGKLQQRLLKPAPVVELRRHIAVAHLKPRNHAKFRAERDQRLVAPLPRNRTRRRTVCRQAGALARSDDRRIKVDGHRDRAGLPHPFPNKATGHLPEKAVTVTARRDERHPLLALSVMHPRNVETVQPVPDRARRREATLATATEPTRKRAAGDTEQLRLEPANQSAKTTVRLQNLNVRYTVETRYVQNQNRQHHLTVAPALQRATRSARKTRKNPPRHQQLQNQNHSTPRRPGPL